MGRASLLGWLEYFARYDRGPAIVQQQGLRREEWSYARVFETACRFASELEARSIRKGDRVLLWGDDSAEWISVFLGCMMRGVVAVPLDRVGSADFARRIFAEVNGQLMVCGRALAPTVADHPHLIMEDVPEMLAGRPADRSFAELTRDDPLQIIFTSGTTGEPKGVVMTHGNVLTNLEPFEGEIAKYMKYERWFHPLRFLELVPLSHVFGQFMGIFLPPLLGAVTVFPERQSPGEVLRQIRRERISLLVAVPRMIESLRNHVERWAAKNEGRDWLTQQFEAAREEKAWRRWWRFRALHRLFGWRFWAIASGGATLEGEGEQFWTRIGIAVLQGYGLTETTSLVSVNHPFQRGAGSIGKVLPGRDLKLSDTGEILVRGGSIARHYWQGGRLTAVGGEDGWFHTGDLGEIDAQGFLRFKGRRKNVIVTPEGMKVYPQDLEGVLRQDPRVNDAVVFGVERDGNAEPAAVLLMHDDSDANTLMREVNQSLAPFQRFRHWYVWPEADFPRTSTQKPKHAEIVARALEHLAGRTKIAGEDGGEIAKLLAQVKRQPVARDADLGLSSLERVELLCALEDRYQVTLDETDFARVNTMDELEQFVSAPEAAPRAARYSYPHWAQSRLIQAIRVVVYHLVTLPATYFLAWPRVTGRNNLRNISGPVLVISNHLTYIDVGFILMALPFRLRSHLAVAMEGEVLQEMRQPTQGNLFSRWITQLAYWLVTALFNVFPLPKTSGFRESFEFAGASLDRGYSVLVFPEGLRSRNGEMAPFRSGIGMLATGLGVPVVPMRIDGLWEVKRQGWRGVAPWGRIKTRIGAPMRFASGEDAERIARRLESAVRQL